MFSDDEDDEDVQEQHRRQNEDQDMLSSVMEHAREASSRSIDPKEGRPVMRGASHRSHVSFSHLHSGSQHADCLEINQRR
jgi:hypothetical protein